MYCSECGQQATGNYCRHCGAPLGDLVPPGELMIDWEVSLDYQVVTSAPEVRTAIARAQAQTQGGVPGAKLLEVADQLATPFTGGISSLTIARIAQPLYAKIGVKTSKQRSELVPLPPGRALACVLCTLARKGNEVVHVEHADDTCTLTANLPADLRSLDGRLSITLQRHPQGTLVTAQALIEGQRYDWGKCRRGLDELFQSLRPAA